MDQIQHCPTGMRDLFFVLKGGLSNQCCLNTGWFFFFIKHHSFILSNHLYNATRGTKMLKTHLNNNVKGTPNYLRLF